MAFDPYHRWFGIPPKHQPPNHYRLLGIELFEDDPEVIETAADQRMMLLRTFQAGQHADDSQRLLNEVSATKVCLLNAARKADYDARLRAATSEEAAATAGSAGYAEQQGSVAGPATPVASGLLESLPQLPPTPPFPATEVPASHPLSAGAQLGVPQATPRRRQPLWQRTPVLLAVGLGGLAGALLLIVLLAQPWAANDQAARRDRSRQMSPGRSSGSQSIGPPKPPRVQGGEDRVGIPVNPTPGIADGSPGADGAASTSPPPAGAGDWNGLDPAATLVAYTFDESTLVQEGGKLLVKDLSGRGSDGVVAGATAVAGRCGGGLYFDGRDDYVVLPQLRDQILSDPDALTILAWVRSQRTGEQYRSVAMMFDVGNYATECLTLCVAPEGQFQFWTPDRHGGGDLRSQQRVDAQWHHLAATWDGAQMRFYVDAQLQARRGTGPLTLQRRSLSRDAARLGGQAKGLFQRGRYFQGVIDEFAFLSTALSPDELRAVYETGQRGRSLSLRN